MFFKLLKDALKVKNVRNKILFTIFIIFVFRVGTHVTVPGINAESLKQLSDLPFLNMLNLVSGNAMNNFSIFSMGVSPTFADGYLSKICGVGQTRGSWSS